MDSYTQNNHRLKPVRIAVIFVVMALIGAGLYLAAGNRGEELPTPGTQPPKEVLSVIDRYIQARENKAGANRATPSSWLRDIKSIVTPSMFTLLQPSDDTITSSISANFTYAHEKGYKVKAVLSNCLWSGDNLAPTSENGVIRGIVVCNLTDQTVDARTGEEIPASSLEFGWPYNGPQQSPILELIRQDGEWLISADETGGAR